MLAPEHAETLPRPATFWPQEPPAAASSAAFWSTRHHFAGYKKAPVGSGCGPQP